MKLFDRGVAAVIFGAIMFVIGVIFGVAGFFLDIDGLLMGHKLTASYQ